MSVHSRLFRSHCSRTVSFSQVFFYFNNYAKSDPLKIQAVVCLGKLLPISQILTPDRSLLHGCPILSTRHSSATQVRFLFISRIREITISDVTPSLLLPHQALFPTVTCLVCSASIRCVPVTHQQLRSQESSGKFPFAYIISLAHNICPGGGDIQCEFSSTLHSGLS